MNEDRSEPLCVEWQYLLPLFIFLHLGTLSHCYMEVFTCDFDHEMMDVLLHLLIELKWEMKLWCFRPLLCTLLRLNWAKQTPGIMRRVGSN